MAERRAAGPTSSSMCRRSESGCRNHNRAYLCPETGEHLSHCFRSVSAAIPPLPCTGVKWPARRHSPKSHDGFFFLVQCSSLSMTLRHLNLPSTPHVPMTQTNRDDSKKRGRINVSNVVQFDEIQPVLAAAVPRNVLNRYSVVQCQRQQERRDVRLSVHFVMLKFPGSKVHYILKHERSISAGNSA